MSYRGVSAKIFITFWVSYLRKMRKFFMTTF